MSKTVKNTHAERVRQSQELSNIIRTVEWLNLNELERLADVPQTVLNKVKNGKFELPQKHIRAIEKELERVSTKRK